MTLGRPYWRFWTASGSSNLGDGIVQVALPLLALELTRSPLLVAGLSVAGQLPWLLFALVAGAIADRSDRRRLLVAVNLGRTVVVCAAALAVATGHAQLWLLYAVALLLGVAETVFDTSAQSVLPMVVPAEQLSRANSRLYGVEVVANTFLGPPLGGLLAGVGIALALTTGSAAYLVAGLALLALRGRFRAERTGPATGLRADIAEGVRYLWGHALLRRLALLVGAITVTFSSVVAVLPVYAVAPGPMGLSAEGYGLFLTSTGIGALLASLSAERVQGLFGAARALRVSIVSVAVLLVAPLLEVPLAVGACWVLGAFFVVVWNVITVTLRQRIVPEHLLGRVNSAYRLLAWGGAPVGAGLGGLVAQLTDPRVCFAAAGLGTLGLLFAMRPLTDSVLTAAE